METVARALSRPGRVAVVAGVVVEVWWYGGKKGRVIGG